MRNRAERLRADHMSTHDVSHATAFGIAVGSLMAFSAPSQAYPIGPIGRAIHWYMTQPKKDAELQPPKEKAGTNMPGKPPTPNTTGGEAIAVIAAFALLILAFRTMHKASERKRRLQSAMSDHR
jgi:hypothetical protein